jgi:acetyl-CoA C-acetyltransferase
MAVGMLATGQASVVIAGGVEAWSRSPIRQTRPLHADELPVAYERPAFAPDPTRDPDLLQSAADYAAQLGITRVQQDAYAVLSHRRALQHAEFLRDEIVSVNGLEQDTYPRILTLDRAARMPIATQRPGADECALSTLAISTKADGAALILLATPQACRELSLIPQIAWLASASIGGDPGTPLLAAQIAAQTAMQRALIQSTSDLQAIELHDAFAVQGLSFCHALGLDPIAINRRGGGLARGHPIGASGAIALVRLLADLQQSEAAGAQGLVAVAGAGGIGSAALLARL